MTTLLSGLQDLRSLTRDEDVAVRVNGSCMEPAIADGEVIRVRAAPRYWPGDVVAFTDAAGRLTVHRVVGWRPRSWLRLRGPWNVWTRADRGPALDTPIPPERVLGRVLTRPGLRDRVAASARLLRHLARRAANRLRPRVRRAG